MFFVGIDLAWSTKNGTGVALLEGNSRQSKLVKHGVLFSDEEIVDFVVKNVGKQNALIAIDAPLIVPNETGRRVAEVEVGKLFRPYNAGAHPANRQRLSSWTGKIRGEELSKKLEKEGFVHNPFLKKKEQSRTFFEVYPHPSMVVLFNLNKVIPYKAKPKRDYDFRWKAFKQYQQHLLRLEKKKPSLILPKEITKARVEELRGSKLKHFEDSLDAVFCGYIAQYAWTFPDKCAVLGNMEKGYILTPVFHQAIV